jgi:hypothetical protein
MHPNFRELLPSTRLVNKGTTVGGPALGIRSALAILAFFGCRISACSPAFAEHPVLARFPSAVGLRVGGLRSLPTHLSSRI